MRPKPYIGITGFMCANEVKGVLSALPRGVPDHLLMVGVLVSNKTLRGEANKWPQRYPTQEALGRIFSHHSNVLNLIHFNTKEPENLFVDLCAAQDLAGIHCHGIQLNMVWPDQEALEKYKQMMPSHHRKVVLQCGGRALDEVGRNPQKLAERVQEYAGLIDYVLIDPSGGLGKEFDQDFAYRSFCALGANASTIGVGIAGGLCADTLDRIEPLMPAAPDFSIDAEGRLRNAADNLHISEAAAYVRKADAIFHKYPAMV